MSLEDYLYKYLRRYNDSNQFLRYIGAKFFLLLPESLRKGKNYSHFKTVIKASSKWTNQQVLDYQNQKFMQTLDAAKKTVFYPRFYSDYGVDINLIKDLSKISTLPIISKATIKENWQNMINPEKLKSGLYQSTSGTSGIPISFYIEKNVSRAKELAFIEDIWQQSIFKNFEKCAVIRGDVTSNSNYRYDYYRDWLILSSYNISLNNFQQYYEELKKFQPRFLYGYPSSLLLLAKYFKYTCKEVPFKLDAIFAGSENIFNDDRNFIESIFQTKVIYWYGHAEKVILGGCCQNSTDYHISPLYGYTEIFRDNENVYNGEGELIGTSFDNAVMPLIRYCTGDIANLSDRQKCACSKNNLYLSYISGREHDFYLTKDGRKISIAAINMHDNIFEKIRQFQFEQSVAGETIFRFTEIEHIENSEIEHIKHELMLKLGADSIIKIVKTDFIPSTVRGKHKFIIQNFKGV